MASTMTSIDLQRAMLAFALAAIATATAAQTTAPAAAAASPAASGPVLPKPSCGDKPEHPGRLASDSQKRNWRRDANTYLECFKKYVEDQRALAQRYQDAANAAIEEYNAAVKNMQQQIDAAAQ
jgi:hypothetical protein